MRAAAASNPNIKNVNSASFLVTPTDILLTVNRTQLVGKYTTAEYARQALEGLLYKLGVKNVDAAIMRLPTTVTHSGASLDIITSATSWNTISVAYQNYEYASTGTQNRFNDINAPILVSFSWTTNLIDLYLKGDISVVSADSLKPSLSDYYKIEKGKPLILFPTRYYRIKGEYTGAFTGYINTLVTDTVTLRNVSTGATIKTIALEATEEY